MKKTFREKVIAKFTGVAKEHRFLKYPCLAAIAVVMFFYYFLMHFVNNGKRYASIVFVAAFFMNSCSFSFAVFAERTGFISAQETYSAVVGDSDITLAVEQPVDPDEQVYPEENKIVSERETEETSEEMIAYTLDDLLADHEEEIYQSSNEEIEMTGEEYVFAPSDWRLVLINKQHPIPEDYEFKLGKTKDNIQCDDRIIEELLLMMQAAQKDGLNLAIRSPYRTSDRQESNFNNRIKDYMRQGLSYMDAYKKTSQVITVPGCSEHEVGLALDITSNTYLPLKQGFADTEEGKWLEEHSCEYGFILRYPEGKEYITSIEYEPWHFRYVGREAAMTMKQENLCLEEFWDRYL